LQRTGAAFEQCVPTEALAEAFVKTRPTSKMLTDFFVNGTTRFPAAGLIEY